MDDDKGGRGRERNLDSKNRWKYLITLESKTDNRREHQILSPACEFFQCDLYNQFLPENLHSERKISAAVFYVP
jgi:hypothetical protein